MVTGCLKPLGTQNIIDSLFPSLQEIIIYMNKNTSSAYKYAWETTSVKKMDG